MDQSDQPIEVKAKPGLNLFGIIFRVFVSFLMATFAYVIINDHVSERMSGHIFVVTMVIGVFWPIIMRLFRPLTPLKGFLLSEGTIPILATCVLAYRFPRQTLHLALQIAWAIFRTKT